MIGKMLRGDVLRFMIIMTIFVASFASALYFLFLESKHHDNKIKNEGFGVPWRAVFSLFGMTLGNFDYKEFKRSRLNWFATGLFAIFMVIAPILLLNMLIAMMAKTYHDVKDRATMESKRQWARIILVMESAMSHKSLSQHRCKYSQTIPRDTTNENSPREEACLQYESVNSRKDSKTNNSFVEPRFLLLIKVTEDWKAKKLLSHVSPVDPPVKNKNHRKLPFLGQKMPKVQIFGSPRFQFASTAKKEKRDTRKSTQLEYFELLQLGPTGGPTKVVERVYWNERPAQTSKSKKDTSIF
ncbi:transient receptor potential cation channel subfamily V member 2-like [Amphiura filiformis]|uniref:transient receptor potential cation channel subfamily V member 2-like n=1 Tax=Amphiura filiformis TaxID=82378 RepID=UPI003B21C143